MQISIIPTTVLERFIALLSSNSPFIATFPITIVFFACRKPPEFFSNYQLFNYRVMHEACPSNYPGFSNEWPAQSRDMLIAVITIVAGWKVFINYPLPTFSEIHERIWEEHIYKNNNYVNFSMKKGFLRSWGISTLCFKQNKKLYCSLWTK